MRVFLHFTFAQKIEGIVHHKVVLFFAHNIGFVCLRRKAVHKRPIDPPEELEATRAIRPKNTSDVVLLSTTPTSEFNSLRLVASWK